MGTTDFVAVLGGGIMGSGIAQVAATAGHPTTLVDVDLPALTRAKETVTASLARFAAKGTLSTRQVDDVLSRIRWTTDLPEAVHAASVVIEAVPERLDVKHAVWRSVRKHASQTALFGTNTSQLSITAIASVLGDAGERLVGMHFFNPPVLMRLVELVRGLATSDDYLERARSFSLGLGKEVVVCKKDSPGFLTSRVSTVLRLECIRMLDEGLADAADIDRAIRLAFNHPMGPLELGDFNGLDTFLHAAEGLEMAHGDRFRSPVSLRNMVAAGRLGRKSGEGFYQYE